MSTVSPPRDAVDGIELSAFDYRNISWDDIIVDDKVI
jgi:hypothetical protein